jgi:subtilisin family serine protease
LVTLTVKRALLSALTPPVDRRAGGREHHAVDEVPNPPVGLTGRPRRRSFARMRLGDAASLAGTLTAAAAVMAGLANPAGAQTPQVRLAAAEDCSVNVNCIPGLRRVYGIDPTSLYTPLAAADAGVQALDDGIAEVAVAFSSNPQLSRPDIVTLRDDQGMISDDHVVPIVRASLLRRYGRPLRRRLNTASALLSTLRLRGLNQQVIDGRIPEAVGGEFADANGLGGPRLRRPGPRIRVGYQAFDENQTLAFFYAEALRGAGYRVRVKATGLRPQTVRALRRGQIDLYPGYSGSLRGFLGGKTLREAAAKIGARPMRLSPAQDRNGFAMKRDVAQALGVSKLSDLKRYWPAATAGSSQARARLAASDPRQGEQWAVAPGSVLDLPAAWQLTQGQGVTVAIVDSGARLDHTDLGANIWTNFDEKPGNGIDDDRNGYVDDVHGVDLSSRRSGQDIHDGWGHGTHVAGIVAAAENNRGVVGVAPRAKLMIVKVLDDTGAGNTGNVAEGIRYAAANGARVINCSLGGDTPDRRMNEAVKAAGEAGALVIASAGNDGRDIDTKPNYPAAIPASNLLAVASTDPDSGRGISEFSNFGRLAVQVAAPGAEILSASNSGGWEIKSGTSMAAPMVTGVAALAASVNPRISAVDLRAVLMQNASRSRLPVAAGYVDALRSALAASHAAGYDTSQPPRLRVLSATRKGTRTRVQVAVLGSTAAIRQYRVTLGGKRAALRARPSPFTVTLRRRGARVEVAAIDAGGRVLTSGRHKVIALRKGKGGVGSGGGVGT